MPASSSHTQALIARLNEKRNASYAEVAAVLDAIIQEKLSEFVTDMQRAHGLSLPEVESATDTQAAMAREWKSSVLKELAERALAMKANAPAVSAVQ